MGGNCAQRLRPTTPVRLGDRPTFHRFRVYTPVSGSAWDFNLATTRRPSSGIGDGRPPTGKDLSRPHAPSGIPGSIESPNHLSHEHVDFEWSTCDPPVLHRCLAPRRHGEVVDR